MTKRPPSYRGLYLIGLSLITLGIAFINLRPQTLGPVFIAVGGLFILLGFNQNNGKKQR